MEAELPDATNDGHLLVSCAMWEYQFYVLSKGPKILNRLVFKSINSIAIHDENAATRASKLTKNNRKDLLTIPQSNRHLGLT